jgi:hypothetical protein
LHLTYYDRQLRIRWRQGPRSNGWEKADAPTLQLPSSSALRANQAKEKNKQERLLREDKEEGKKDEDKEEDGRGDDEKKPSES